MKSSSYIFLALLGALSCVCSGSIATKLNDLEDCRVAISNAITAKGVAAPYALNQMSNAVMQIQQGGGGSGEAGNGLPVDCPRIDKIDMASLGYECYFIVHDLRGMTGTIKDYDGGQVDIGNRELREVIVSNDGTVTETSNYSVKSATSANTLTLNCGAIVVVRSRALDSSAKFTALNTRAYYRPPYTPMAFRAHTTAINVNLADNLGVNNQFVWAKYVAFDGVDGQIMQANIKLAYLYWTEFFCDAPLECATISVTVERLKFKGLQPATMYGFYGTKARYLDLSGCDFSAVTSMTQNLNAECYLVLMPTDPNKGMRISFMMKSEKDISSLLSILNSLYDHATAGTGQTPTLTIGATNLAKLTAEQKAIATNKGWTLQ